MVSFVVLILWMVTMKWVAGTDTVSDIEGIDVVGVVMALLICTVNLVIDALKVFQHFSGGGSNDP